ncbi:putative T7SS-secreted protein [Rhodococcus opacus]|uniref:Rhs protein n=1 Tax=Rhodococcus opacus (strain B4) TaxID=632772 RepID=C1B7X0_RHOOB|nr:hypothetical protein ROP_35260 [Rhodococcus opacus B4]
MSWLSDTWDDAKGAIDEFGDAAEDAIESTVENVGQAVDSGLDSAAGLAHRIGADGVADTLTDLGDEIAGVTGGPVDELDLGQTEDPKELIRGEPSAISEATTTLTDLATSIGSTGDALLTVDAAGWTGSAADGFNEVFDKQPGLWHDAADAMNSAAQTLVSWGHTVEAAQARAADAVARWKQADDEERAKKSAYNALTGEQQADNPLVDTWTAMREEARDILRGARAERDGVAGQVSGALNGAAATAPTEPPFTERWMNNLTDATDGVHLGVANFYSGLLTGLSGIVQFVRQVNPTATYNMTHPADYQAGLSNLATGIVIAAADPGTVVSTIVGDIRKNPLEFAGGLTGDAVLTAATGGAGAGVAGARTAVHVLDTAGDLGNGARLLDDVADVSHLPKPDTPHPDTHPAGADPVPSPEPAQPGPAERADADSGVNDAAHDAGPETDRTSDQNCEGRDPVDVATGEFLLPETDLTLPGVLPLVFGRRHRSGYRFGRWFGPSWSSTVDMRVVVEEPGVTLLAEDGVMLTYPHPEVGAPVMPDSGQRWPLSRTDTGGYQVSDPDRGLTWHFAPKPELGGLDSALGNLAISAITDRHRNRILFRYDASGAPVEMSHSGGYRVLVDTRAGRIVGLSVVDGDGATPIRRFAASTTPTDNSPPSSRAVADRRGTRTTPTAACCRGPTATATAWSTRTTRRGGWSGRTAPAASSTRRSTTAATRTVRASSPWSPTRPARRRSTASTPTCDCGTWSTPRGHAPTPTTTPAVNRSGSSDPTARRRATSTPQTETSPGSPARTGTSSPSTTPAPPTCGDPPPRRHRVAAGMGRAGKPGCRRRCIRWPHPVRLRPVRKPDLDHRPGRGRARPSNATGPDCRPPSRTRTAPSPASPGTDSAGPPPSPTPPVSPRPTDGRRTVSSSRASTRTASPKPGRTTARATSWSTRTQSGPPPPTSTARSTCSPPAPIPTAAPPRTAGTPSADLFPSRTRWVPRGRTGTTRSAGSPRKPI